MKIDKYLVDNVDYYLVCERESGIIIESNPRLEFSKIPQTLLNLFKYYDIKVTIDIITKVDNFLSSCELGNTVLVFNDAEFFVCKIIDIIGNNIVINFHKITSAMPKIKTYLSRTMLDPLTKLLQKDAIELNIENWILHHPETKASMFMIDVDYFKNINDNYGHLVGDKVLIEIAEVLKGLGTDNINIGRIGGDEFLVFIEQPLDNLGLKNIARLIRYGLDNIEIDGIPFSISCTIGICEYPTYGKNFTELYRNCDKALYRGKIKGRNCHIIYDPAKHSTIQKNLTENNIQLIAEKNQMSAATFLSNMLKKTIVEDFDITLDCYKIAAEYLNLDRIVVVLDGKTSVVYNKNNVDVNYDEIDMDEYVNNFVVDDMFYMNDYEIWKKTNPKLYKIYNDSQTKSFVQVIAKTKDDKIRGFASLESISTKRVWQRNEINIIIILVKLANMIITHKGRYKK